MLLWSGDHGLDLFDTWALTIDQQKDLKEYWTRFEDHVKPQANHILNRYYLRSLKQNNRPLDTFLTKARLLIQSSGYPQELHDELMRDTLVFGTNSKEVRRKCIARANKLTFTKAKEIAHTEKATQMQLKAMSDSLSPSQLQQPDGEVNAVSKGKETEGRRSKGKATRWPENKPKQCYRLKDSCHAKG